MMRKIYMINRFIIFHCLDDLIDEDNMQDFSRKTQKVMSRFWRESDVEEELKKVAEGGVDWILLAWVRVQ